MYNAILCWLVADYTSSPHKLELTLYTDFFLQKVSQRCANKRAF